MKYTRCIPVMLRLFQERHLLTSKKYTTLVAKIGSTSFNTLLALQPFCESLVELLQSNGV